MVLPVLAQTEDQDTLWLRLEDCISRAIESSPNAYSARYDSISAAGQWMVARGSKYPQLKLSGQFPTWERSVAYSVRYDADLGYDTYSRIPSENQIWRGILNLDQNLPWGATLNLSSSLLRLGYMTDYGDTTFNIQEYSWRQSVILSQPLLEGNPVGRENRINEIEWVSSLIGNELSVRSNRYRAIQLFFGLVSAYGQAEIARQDYEQGVLSVGITERKFNAGLVPEVDLLRIQVDVARRENSWRQAQGGVEGAMDDLRMELGISFERPLAPLYQMDSLVTRSVESIPVEGEPLELVRDKMNLDRIELETRSRILTQRIQATLDLFYEIDSRNEDIEKLSTDGDKNYGITLHVEFPIFGFGTTTGTIQTIRAGLEKEKVNHRYRTAQSAAELRQALRSAHLVRERIRIADASLDLALKGYDITNQRFNVGLISSKDLIDAQLDLTRTRREALSARIDYELALAYLEKIAPVDVNTIGIKLPRR